MLDAPDVQVLGRFYARLLEWEVFKDEENEFVLAAPQEGAYLAVQLNTRRNMSSRCGRRPRVANR